MSASDLQSVDAYSEDEDWMRRRRDLPRAHRRDSLGVQRDPDQSQLAEETGGLKSGTPSTRRTRQRHRLPVFVPTRVSGSTRSGSSNHPTRFRSEDALQKAGA
ncbi:hypothetical protein C8039_17290 [Halogeometricum sp. wsp3]|nr:hypothetical protein C8039_17290 [Halogeometricum sp. wsp3]